MGKVAMTASYRCAVNLDHVARVCKVGDGRNQRYELLSVTGECLGVVDVPGERIGLEELLAPIIPAAAGAWVYVFGIDGSGRPTAESVYSEKSQVIAWHALDEYPQPILCEPIASNETIMFPQPDGRVVHPLNSSYANFEGALAGYLDFEQWKWDQAHPAVAAPAAE